MITLWLSLDDMWRVAATIENTRMVEHHFGGPWTEIKLDAVCYYLECYTKALSQRQFDLWYVDVFAGSGDRTNEKLTGGLLERQPVRWVWATHFSDLNDASEVKFLQEPLTRALADRCVNLVRMRQKENVNLDAKVQSIGGPHKVGAALGRELVKLMYQVTFDDGGDFGPPFIASFCSHAADQPYEQEHGLLSQWRGYGRDGGYCIVFDTSKLVDLLGKEYAAFGYVHLDISPARYNYEEDDVTDAFPELISICERFVSEVLDGNRQPLAGDALGPFLKGATLLKHRGFYEEREVRIVAMPSTAALQERVKQADPGSVLPPLKPTFSPGGDRGPRRHISLLETLHSELPISRVIVGPSRDQQTNFAKARDILGSALTVSKSATPFLG